MSHGVPQQLLIYLAWVRKPADGLRQQSLALIVPV